MKHPILISLDLEAVRPFRIEGDVLVTLPSSGPLLAVSTRFQAITKQSLLLLIETRDKEAMRLREAEVKAVKEWQATRGYTPRMIAEQLDLERENDNG